MKNKSHYNDASEYCHYFFDLVPTSDLLHELVVSRDESLAVFRKISPALENHAYMAGKWTVREVVRHIIDCERVYAYRAMRFSRFDATPLPGFDEDEYIRNVAGGSEPFSEMINEYIAVREATITLYQYMSDSMMDFRGTANEVVYTARSLGFMTVGHNLHHCRFLDTHYLNT
ncbi:MAG: DinB family protein [Flavobacteriales bacterium]|nr:DinB family protein [Flavobacteriales bacterium]